MTKNMSVKRNYFMGNEVSKYGVENGYVDYLTLAKSFDHVLNNNIISKEVGYWEIESGTFYNEDDGYKEIFQYYIISDTGAEILKDWTDELVFYNSELELYLWGVTHFGTGWDYVLTDIKIEE